MGKGKCFGTEGKRNDAAEKGVLQRVSNVVSHEELFSMADCFGKGEGGETGDKRDLRVGKGSLKPCCREGQNLTQ